MSPLDPRTKLVLLIVFTVIVMMTPSIAALALAGLLVVALALARRLHPAWMKLLRALLPLVVFLFVFYLWAFDWETAFSGALRLLITVSAFFVFFQLTAPEDLASTLVQSGVPYSFAFILTSAMQFAPIVTRQARDIFDAQRARGIRLEADVASLRNFPALLAPLLIQSFALAEQLAEAMEARGFSAPRRTRMRAYRMTRVDALVVALALVVLMIAVRIR